MGEEGGLKQWMAKLGRGMARLAVWRKRAALADDAAADRAEARASPVPPAIVSVAQAADSGPAPVAGTPVPVDRSPAMADDVLVDGLAELGDPVSAPVDSVDILFGDDLAELDDLSAPMQNEVMSADTLYTDTSTDGLAELDALSDPEPLETHAAQAAPSPSATPDHIAAVATEVIASPPELHDAVSANDSNAPPVSRLQRLIGDIHLFAGRIRQFRLNGAGLKGDGPSRLLGKKRVWIASASLMLLGVVGSLTFMLLQSFNEKSRLQAELSAAKQALRQADAKPPVAVIPPLLPAPVPPPEAAHAKPQAEPQAEPASAPVYLASASSKRAPVQMDCELSDKASVGLNLKKCIEAFNQATGH